jgi:hypothetical protein
MHTIVGTVGIREAADFDRGMAIILLHDSRQGNAQMEMCAFA